MGPFGTIFSICQIGIAGTSMPVGPTLRRRFPPLPKPQLAAWWRSTSILLILLVGLSMVMGIHPDAHIASLLLQLIQAPRLSMDASVLRLVRSSVWLKRAGCRAVAIEDLNFEDLRAGSRERHGRGRRGKQRRRTIAGMPTRRFRTRLVQMCANQGMWVVAVDPAYTSRWGREHWLSPLQERTQAAVSVHHAAAVVIGRRAVGYRARRRPHVPAGDQRIAYAESCGSGQIRTEGVQGPDLPKADSAARNQRTRQAPANGGGQGLGRPRPVGATQRRLDSRRR